MLPKGRRPTHPGEIIRYEFLEPLNTTQQQFAGAIGVLRVRINEIILGKRSVTPNTTFRLAKFVNTHLSSGSGFKIMWICGTHCRSIRMSTSGLIRSVTLLLFYSLQH